MNTTPVLTELQRREIRTRLIAMQQAQLAYDDVIAWFTVPGYLIDLSTITYVPKPDEP